jgi:hypothetical protein
VLPLHFLIILLVKVKEIVAASIQNFYLPHKCRGIVEVTLMAKVTKTGNVKPPSSIDTLWYNNEYS